MNNVNAEQQIQYIPVNLLEFDPKNPRLPKRLIGRNESEVLTWMLNDATLLELMASIAQQGFFPGEPLLVIPSEHNSGKYTVIEGNRRLSAVKLLLNHEIAETKQNSVAKIIEEATVDTPTALPAIIYRNRNEILDYLGYRHITGIKAWEPLAKAQYLAQLAEKINEPDPQEKFKQLAKIIGSKANYVAELLTGLAIYKQMEDSDFFGFKGINETTIDFSLITTALHYSNIETFLGLTTGHDPGLNNLNKQNLKDLTGWMFDKQGGRTRLGESRNLRVLNAVVSSPEALKAFRETNISLEDASLLTKLPTEIFRQAIEDADNKLALAQGYIHKVTDIDKRDIESIENLEKRLRTMRIILIQLLPEINQANR